MRAFLTLFIALLLVLACGCEVAGDLLLNASSGPVTVTLTMAGGLQDTFTLGTGGLFTFHRHPRIREDALQTVVARDAKGRLIGEYSAKDIPRNIGPYKRYGAM